MIDVPRGVFLRYSFNASAHHNWGRWMDTLRLGRGDDFLLPDHHPECHALQGCRRLCPEG